MILSDTLPDGEYVTTADGKIFVRQFGKGAPLLVVNGGPGMSHTYLVHPLMVLSDVRTLIFYDQYGCGRDRREPGEATASKMVRQLVSLVGLLREKGARSLSLVTHSWGMYLAAMILRNDDLRPFVSELTMVSPLPLTDEALGSAFQRLRSRIPPDQLHRIESLAKQSEQSADLKYLSAIIPYYTDLPSSLSNLQIDFYSREVNRNVLASLGRFDISDVADWLPEKSMLIQGDRDFVTQADVEILHRRVTYTTTIEGAGHFPFIEFPGTFTNVLSRLFY